MNPLQLQQDLLLRYVRYLITRAGLRRPALKTAVKQMLLDEGVLTRDAWIEALPDYRQTTRLKDVQANGQRWLCREFIDVVYQPTENDQREGFGVDWSLYPHQEEAIGGFADGKNVIVASGTGSGKTECFLIPIINDLLKNPRQPHETGIRTLILYPMNALVNNQVDRLRSWLSPQTDGNIRITFSLYTSRTPKKDTPKQKWQPAAELANRIRIRATPPDILITNYSMLSYALMRSEDVALFGPGLRHVVIDEGHVYTGALATEIMMLLRHLLKRCKRSSADVKFVITSATLTDRRQPPDQQQEELRNFASGLTTTPAEHWTAIQGVQPILRPTERNSSYRPGIDRLAEVLKFPDCAREMVRDSIAQIPGVHPASWNDFTVSTFDCLGQALQEHPVAINLQKALSGGARPLKELCLELWDHPDAEAEARSWLSVLSCATINGKQMLGLRAHLFFRSPIGLFVCSNPECFGIGRENTFSTWGPWGAILRERLDQCPYCKSRVLELATCIECGQEYAVALRRNESDPLRHLPPNAQLEERDTYHLLLEAIETLGDSTGIQR